MNKSAPVFDPVSRPAHYNLHASGVECIEVVEWFPACLANAWKYLHRKDLKDKPLQDLQKSSWYVRREILRRGKLARQKVALDFFCPSNLEKKVARFLRYESGPRRDLFAHLWTAANHPQDLESLKMAQIILEQITAQEINTTQRAKLRAQGFTLEV